MARDDRWQGLPFKELEDLEGLGAYHHDDVSSGTDNKSGSSEALLRHHSAAADFNRVRKRRNDFGENKNKKTRDRPDKNATPPHAPTAARRSGWSSRVVLVLLVGLAATAFYCFQTCCEFPTPISPYPSHGLEPAWQLINGATGVTNSRLVLDSDDFLCRSAFDEAISQTQTSLEDLRQRTDISGGMIAKTFLRLVATLDSAAPLNRVELAARIDWIVRDLTSVIGYCSAAIESTSALASILASCQEECDFKGRKLYNGTKQIRHPERLAQSKQASSLLEQQRQIIIRMNSSVTSINDILINSSSRYIDLATDLVSINSNITSNETFTAADLKQRVHDTCRGAALNTTEREHLTSYFQDLEKWGRSQCWRCSGWWRRW